MTGWLEELVSGTFSGTLIHGSEKSRFKTHILEHFDAGGVLIKNKNNPPRGSDSRPFVWPSFIQSYITFLLDPTKGHWTLCFYISDSIFYFPKGLVWGSGLGIDSKEVVGSLNSSLWSFLEEEVRVLTAGRGEWETCSPPNMAEEAPLWHRRQWESYTPSSRPAGDGLGTLTAAPSQWNFIPVPHLLPSQSSPELPISTHTPLFLGAMWRYLLITFRVFPWRS